MPTATTQFGNAPYGTGQGTTVLPLVTVFETPQVRDRPPYLPESTRREVMLWRHYKNRLRGVLVWQRSDGTFCVDSPCNYEAAQTHLAGGFTDDPAGPDSTADYDSTMDATFPQPNLAGGFSDDPAVGDTDVVFDAMSDTNVNYPWNPFPGSTNSMTPGSFAYNVNWDRTTQDFVLDPYLYRWYEGGTIIPISQQEALLLTAAGFGDCITVMQGIIDTSAPIRELSPPGPPSSPGMGYAAGRYGTRRYGG